MSLIPTGAYINEVIPWWSQDIFGTPANIEVSTLSVNATPAGNILLENPAPLIFQRSVGDPNAPSESLVMISSIDVPTKLVNGQYIAATKAAGTAYDDIAVQGLQVYGNQTTTGNLGAAAYITGDNGNLILAAKNSVLISSLAVSSLIAGTIISTAINTATSYTATLFMSTPILYADSISSIGISTNTIQAVTGNFSTLNVSTLNAPSFVASTLSTIAIDAKFTLTSTLSLTGNPTNIDLGLGDVIQGLVGGAATQALGAGLGGAGLITGAAALVTGRTSGGVNPNIFQTINGSTQLQFSTIGQAVSSVFLTTISPDPLTTPGLETSTTINVAAGTYCVRSVGDPLYITNNVSSIQMFGQWVPVIQPTATASALAISSFNVSSINGATYPPPGSAGIPSTIALSTATIDGNFTQSGIGTFNWGGNTMSPTQVVFNRATSVNNTFTTTGGAFLNAGATINNGLTVASGPTNLNTGLTVGGGVTQMTNSLTVFGQVAAQAGLVVNGGNAQFNGPTIATNTFSANGLATLNGGVRSPAISTINISTANINVSSVNGAVYPPPGGGGIPSTLAISTATIDGNFTQSGTGTFNWGGNTLSPTQVVLSQPTSVNNSLTTSGVAFLNGSVAVNGGLSVNGGMSVNTGSLSAQGGLSVLGTATFNNQVNMLQNASINGSLIVNNGTNLYNGVNVVSGNFTMNQFGAIASVPILNATATIRSPAISTINISTNNINVNTINNAAYPPPSGGGIPSTLNASTINVNGGQTITNGGLVVSGGNVTIQNPATMNNSLTILGQTFAVGGLVVEPPGAIFNGSIGATTTIQVAGLATLNGGVITPALSTNTISSASLFISSINNASYPPPFGIPSTLNASTLNVNGGQTITAGGLTISGGGTISDGGLWRYRLASIASAISFQQSAGNNDSVILDLNSNKTARFYSTLVVRDSPFPSLQPSQASIRTYTTTDPVPYGSVITSNVSTFNVASQYATISTISTSFISSGIITASNIGCFNFSSLSGSINTFVTSNVTAGVSITAPSLFATNIQTSNTITSLTLTTGVSVTTPSLFATNIQTSNSVTSPTLSTININLSTINGIEYPPPPSPSPFLVPTGSITIWAGGNDNGVGTQTFNVPSGWLLCDGSILSQVTYSALYAVIGQKYLQGYPPGPLSFYLPDLTFAVPMGTPFRNYAQTFNNAAPFVGIGFNSWTSTYITNPAIQACWKITSTYRGTLNYGTIFPVGSVEGLGIAVYVSQILQYDGNQGYIIVTSADGVSSIPNFGSAFKQGQGQGTIEQAGGDFLYTLGSFNVVGRPLVTHNQTNLEVAVHQHNMGPDGFPPFPTGPSIATVTPNIRAVLNPGGVVVGQSTISTIGTGPVGFEDSSNIGTYTAPNFINMLYIIKT